MKENFWNDSFLPCETLIEIPDKYSICLPAENRSVSDLTHRLAVKWSYLFFKYLIAHRDVIYAYPIRSVSNYI